MNVATCWKWFDDGFCLEVKKRTGCSVLLLLDYAPGHFPAFERGNIKVVFFSPNCTSWKQPCEMGIIAALKKRYKYFKGVLDFYELDNKLKAHKKRASKKVT